MSQYALLREDLDNLLEVCQWPNSSDPMKSIESKVKASFTRTYNKDVILPYATNLGSVAKRWIWKKNCVKLGIEEGFHDENRLLILILQWASPLSVKSLEVFSLGFSNSL